MNLLRDKQVKGYLLTVLLICLVTAGVSLLFCLQQARAARRMLLGREQAIAGALLDQAVPPERIAAAFADPEVREQGRELLARMGRTEETPLLLFPALQGFLRNAVLGLFPGILLCMALFFGAALRFLSERDRLYRDAEQAVRRFADGDFRTHLPRTGEGTLWRLFAAVDDLASALQSKGETEHNAKEFLKETISDISHQLKTPLAALRMYHEIILEAAAEPEVVAGFSQKTASALDRMEGLIRALLKITRLDAGGIVFRKERVLAADLVRRAAEELETRAEREQKTLVISGSSEETAVCDLEWTAEALGNLLKNALDHTPAGGQIHVRWERTPAVLRITVSDNGCGIAPEDLHHIFKRFYRSSHALDRQGVGLGLPLAKAILEGQGGMLSVQSVPGEGAAFSVSFLTEL